MDQQTSTLSQPVPVSSFMTRATGVFTSPGEVFSEVAASPVQTSSWMLPFIITLLISLVFTVVLFNNQSLRQQILEPQQQQMQKQVEAGKMTQDQYDKAVSFMDSPMMFIAFGAIASCVFVSAAMFLVPLILMLAAKLALKTAVGYKKMLEVFGLTSLIGILGAIITLLLMHLFDSVHASLGGSLLVMNGYDQTNMAHKLIASINVFGLWQTALVGLGISKVTGKSTQTGMGVAFALWVLWVVAAALLNLSGK